MARAGLTFCPAPGFLPLGGPDATLVEGVARAAGVPVAGACTASSATGDGSGAGAGSGATFAGSTGFGGASGIGAGAGSLATTGSGGGAGRGGGDVATGAGPLVLASAVFSGARGGGVSAHKTRKPKTVRPTIPKRKSLIGDPPLPDPRRPTPQILLQKGLGWQTTAEGLSCAGADLLLQVSYN